MKVPRDKYWLLVVLIALIGVNCVYSIKSRREIRKIIYNFTHKPSFEDIHKDERGKYPRYTMQFCKQMQTDLSSAKAIHLPKKFSKQASYWLKYVYNLPVLEDRKDPLSHLGRLLAKQKMKTSVFKSVKISYPEKIDPGATLVGFYVDRTFILVQEEVVSQK